MKRNLSEWLSYGALGLGCLSVLLAVAGAVGNHLGLLHFRLALNLFRWGAMLGMAVAIGAVLLLATALIRKAPKRQMLASLLGLGLGLAIFVPAWRGQARAKSVPPIHDISTDTLHPPELKAVLAQRPQDANPATYGGPDVARQQQAAYPDIQPALLSLDPKQAHARALEVAKTLGWQIIAAEPESGRIEAVATTFFFGFHDDVVIRVQSAGIDRSKVDIRSVSRVGKSDVGTNAARIRRFMELLKQG
ncbi:MAG: DUF1499 domain-containing protein [Candidatus Sericytochromatia bacterium]